MGVIQGQLRQTMSSLKHARDPGSRSTRGRLTGDMETYTLQGFPFVLSENSLH